MKSLLILVVLFSAPAMAAISGSVTVNGGVATYHVVDSFRISRENLDQPSVTVAVHHYADQTKSVDLGTTSHFLLASKVNGDLDALTIDEIEDALMAHDPMFGGTP